MLRNCSIVLIFVLTSRQASSDVIRSNIDVNVSEDTHRSDDTSHVTSSIFTNADAAFFPDACSEIYENINSTNLTSPSCPGFLELQTTNIIVPAGSRFSWQQIQLKNLNQYCAPILIVVGTVGNLIAAVSLQSRLFNKTPTTRFILTVLAICDVFLLCTGLLRIYLSGAFNNQIRNYSSAGCKLHVFLTYVSVHLSPWAVVMMTVERTISVYFPLQCRQICSARRIKFGWLAFVVAIIAVDFHLLFSYDLVNLHVEYGLPGGRQCFPPFPWLKFVFTVYIWIDVILADFLPFIMILIGNILIISKIIQARRMRLSNMQDGGDQTKQAGKSTSSATYVLILVSAYFLITRVPKNVYFLGSYSGLVNIDYFYSDDSIQLFYMSTMMIYYSNSAVEFVFYFVSGDKFRSAFMDVFGIRRAKV